MAKKPTKKQLEGAAAMMANDEAYQRIFDVWRAVLGLPRDFAICPTQIVVCMTAAQLFMVPDVPTPKKTTAKVMRRGL